MSADHVVMGNNSFRCLHCGEEYVMAMPASIGMFTGAASGFADDHQHCEPSARGRARFAFSTPEEWVRSWDTGLSSLTIYNFMFLGMTARAEIPHDPGDFGRCYRLLKAFPAWRDRLPAMGEAIPLWKPLADEWSVLEYLYEEEMANGTGKAPQLYAALQKLNCAVPARVDNNGETP